MLQQIGEERRYSGQPNALVRVRLVRTALELQSLRPEWQRLHSEAAVASVFNDWAWQAAWWRLYGRERELQVIVATRGDKTVGILPLYAQTTTQLGLPVRMLRLLGEGGDTYPDDLGPLFARGEEAELAIMLATAMLRLPSYDVAALADIDASSEFPAALAATAQLAQLRCSLGRAQRIACLRLPDDWNDFLASVSGHRRAQIRQKRLNLEREHRTRFFVWNDAERLGAAVLRLAELHRKRWGAASSAFASAEYRELHLATMRDALARDRLRLYCLEIGGDLAAMLYAYRLREHIFLVQAGFNPQYARWSPGSVLLEYALEHAITEGNHALDFLRGEHRYKERLATHWRETVSVTVCRPTIAAAAFRARKVYVARTNAKVRNFAKSVSLP